ncbi:hypothetical protein RFI_04163 [Reticulomyxa filosa]|uniref:Uncharacterized protein n=1 Tax=Reticulomyxa filosa TaxID=46433 RepID=X6P495_RETFI|nr:hypothetical protein RFI_04163 [Reticulomyxa filosa]|eukprot:ETO32943.1 hypothetical protein RFI_04163 [Reticulomyxa filosa]
MHEIDILTKWNDINICRCVKGIIVKTRVFFKFIFFPYICISQFKQIISSDDVATSNNNTNSTLAPYKPTNEDTQKLQRPQKERGPRAKKKLKLFQKKHKQEQQMNKMDNSGGDVRSVDEATTLNHWTLGAFVNCIKELLKIKFGICLHKSNAQMKETKQESFKLFLSIREIYFNVKKSHNNDFSIKVYFSEFFVLLFFLIQQMRKSVLIVDFFKLTRKHYLTNSV